MIGASEIVMAVKLRHEIKGEWLLILMGLASIVFAVLLLWNPVRWCSRSGVVNRLLRNRVRNFGDHLWLSLAQLALPGDRIIIGTLFKTVGS